MIPLKPLLFILGSLLFQGCVGPNPELFPPKLGEKTQTVYLLNHGWHTGLVIPTAALDNQTCPPAPFFRNEGQAVEFGWGDEGFYRAQKITSGLSVRAMFWPTSTVLHCVVVEKSVEQFFPKSGIIKITLSEAGFKKMCSFLASTYHRNTDGTPISLGPGLYGHSQFYKAHGKYYIFNTCNKWTARALRAAGCPISPFYALRAENVFSQTSKFGTTIREFNNK